MIQIEDEFLIIGGKHEEKNEVTLEVITERCKLKEDKMECVQQDPEFDTSNPYDIWNGPALFAVKPYFCKFSTD